MKILSFKSIKSQLAFWFLFLTLVPLLVWTLIIFDQEKRAIEYETTHKLTAIRDLKVQQLEGWLKARIGDIQVMSGDFELRRLEDALKGESKTTENIKNIEIARELLNRNIRNYDDYEEIFIIEVNSGLVEISSNISSEGDNKSQELYYTVPLKTGEIYIRDIYYSKKLNRPQMTFSIPIYCKEQSKHIIGVLVARIDLNNSLYNFLANRVGLGETGETLIVNKDVIALNELLWYENAPLSLQISAKPAINAAQGKTGIILTSDYRGEDVLAAYTYIPETEWGFVCKQDMTELNAPIRALFTNFIVLLLISVLVIVITVFWLTKLISKPIVDMSNATRKIRGSDYSTRTIVSSRDELASLADSINEMAISIESNNKIQKAITDISAIVILQSSLREFSSRLVKHLMKITGTNISIFYILNDATSEYEPLISFGFKQELVKSFNVKYSKGEITKAISRKQIYYLRDIPEPTIVKFSSITEDAKPKEIITIPVLVDGNVIALISIVNTNKFDTESYEVIKQSWHTINTSYSSLLSNERIRVLAESLTTINRQLEVKNIEITESKEALSILLEDVNETSEKLQKSNIKLDSANKELQDFAYSVSHDLKAPLRAISQLSYWISQDYYEILDKDGKEQLMLLGNRVKRMDLLIDGILQYSRVGKVRETDVLINLNILVKDVIDSLAVPQNIKINIVSILPDYKCDETRFIQIFQNLISNSIKFMDKPFGKVSIDCSDAGSNWKFSVRDNGPGIEEKYFDRVFKIFQTLKARDTQEGTGLGLALVKKIIKIYKGDIWIESKVGNGTTIFFTLPKR